MPATREKIVDATRQVLESEGAAAVTMRRIAGQCEISAMAPYWYFANREALLEAVCTEAFDEVAAQWRQRPRHPDPIDDLSAMADLLLDFALARPRLYDYMFVAVRPGARQLPGDDSPTLSLLIEALRDGMRSGALRQDDPTGLALTLAAQLHGLIALHHGGRIGLSDDGFRGLCHDSLRRIFDGIRA